MGLTGNSPGARIWLYGAVAKSAYAADLYERQGWKLPGGFGQTRGTLSMSWWWQPRAKLLAGGRIDGGPRSSIRHETKTVHG
jgi:hypothetical protein